MPRHRFKKKGRVTHLVCPAIHLPQEGFPAASPLRVGHARQDFFSEAKREKEVYFGQNALCEFLGASSFEITVGDVATVEW